MGNTFGRSSLLNVGHGVKLTADGRPEFKHIGVTIDWSTIAAQSGSDATYQDGVVVAVGEKALRYGQVITKITKTAIDVVTLNNTPTGGTFKLSVTAGGTTTTTGAIAFDATGPIGVQAALVALSNVGAGNATVTGNASGPYTITFADAVGAVTLTGDGALLTGAGAQPTATVVQTDVGGNLNMYGPYDTAAVDGRQTLTPGAVFIVNETWKETDLHSNHPPVIEGGKVWKARLIATAGTHSLANGPTFTELLAVLPRLTFVAD